MRGWLKRGLVVVAALAALAASTEQVLEARDRAIATADSTFFSVHGRRVRYLLAGREHGGPTIVLTSGMTATLEQWEPVQQGLSAYAQVLTYDRAGTGFSESSAAYDAVTESDELAELLAVTGKARRCIVVGYSGSAFLARVFASRYPTLVRGIVLIDPATRDDHAAVPPYRVISYRRDFVRGQVTASLKALFGITRLQQAIELRDTPALTPAEAKGRMALVSFHHWLAVGKDALSLDTSSAQAEAARPALVPASILSTNGDPLTFAQQKEIATAMRGTLRVASHIDHAGLTRAGTDSETIAIILEMLQRARASDLR